MFIYDIGPLRRRPHRSRLQKNDNSILVNSRGRLSSTRRRISSLETSIKAYGNSSLPFVPLCACASWKPISSAGGYNKHADYSNYRMRITVQDSAIPPCVSFCLGCVELNDYARMNGKPSPESKAVDLNKAAD